MVTLEEDPQGLYDLKDVRRFRTLPSTLLTHWVKFVQEVCT